MPGYYGGGPAPRTVPKNAPKISKLMVRLLERRS
jgi:hypothetical protein